MVVFTRFHVVWAAMDRVRAAGSVYFVDYREVGAIW